MNDLIDTCVISEMIKPFPEVSVLSWWDSCIKSQIYISSLSIGELHFGISRLLNGKKKDDLLAWFKQIVIIFSGRLLPITDKTSIIWAEMRTKAERKGVQLPVIDGLLAATAKEHDLIFVTRNIRDVDITEVVIYNPWDK
jgi:toxin FitB